MCRFSHKEEDGYRKISRELQCLCEGIEKAGETSNTAVNEGEDVSR